MAATDKPLRDQRTLDIVFAVSNILMLFSVAWMLWQDYAREYKDEQRAFRDVEVAMAQHAALAQIPPLEEFNEKKAAVKKAHAFREANDEALKEARNKMRNLQPQREIADAAYQAAKAEVDSKNSFLEIALESGDKDTVKKLRETLVELNGTLAEKQAKRDGIVNELKEQQLKIDEYEGPYTKAVAAFKKVNDKFDAQVKLALSKSWGWDDRFRTLPVINGFADPLKIQQFTINDIPIDYNFKYVTRFDRCMTCHLAIDRPTYTRESLAALNTDASQADLDRAIKMYEERTDRELFDPKESASIPNPKKIRLISLGDKTLSPARIKEFTAHPRLDLFVGSGSKHPAEKFGCSSCHYGQGSGTTFLDSSHSPNTGATREEWAKTKHWSPNHDWDFPMLPHRFIESSCLKCHHEVTDLISSDNRVEAPKVVRGFNLIKENGCFGCHEISGWKSGNRVGPDLRLEPTPPLEDLTPLERDRAINDPDNRPGALRKVGPALSRLSEKVKDGWIEKWLYKPSTFRPDTKMPQYFNLSTNDPKALEKYDEVNGKDKDGKPNPNFLMQEKFPNTEIASIAHFLKVTSDDYLAGIAKHQNDDVAKKTADENRLLELINKGRLDADDQKEFTALKQRIKLRKEMKPVKDDTVPQGDAKAGRKLFIERGCLSCHTHQGTEPAVTSAAVFGPNLSQLPAKLGNSEQAHKWLTHWILDPKAYSPRTRMPQTHLEPQEAADVAAWLLGEKAMDLGKGWDEVAVNPPALKDLQDLATVYLTRMLSKRDIELFFKGKKGEADKLAVTVMLNDVTDDEKKLFDSVTDENALKYYLGKKAVNRLGCFGCHDIPGFENAKPIGTGLNDWGKKPADRLAFEDIGNFFQNHYFPVPGLTDKDGKPYPIKEEGGVKKEPYEKFYADALLGHHPERMGYLNQKIRDPRSYDYNRVRTWDDRARMPKFTFSRPRRHQDEADADFDARIMKEEAEAREAVASFILGLTAETVPAKMTNQPTGDRLSEVKGRQVLDKFNCAGCHLIRPGVYDFKLGPQTLSKLEDVFIKEKKYMQETGEIDFPNHVNWVGRNSPDADWLTAYALQPKLLEIPDENGDKKPWLRLNPAEALRFRQQAPDKDKAKEKVMNIAASTPIFIAVEDLPGGASIKTQEDVDRLFSASQPYGGTFADLLTPYLNKQYAEKYKDASAARAALPPSLIGQGERTQPEWLYQFLLDPHKVRRLSILRMPKFNMSPGDAKALTEYFAGVTRLTNPGIGLTAPFDAIPQRGDLDSPYWRGKTAEYVKRLRASPAIDTDGKVIKGMTAYEQRVKEYKPLWEKLSKTQPGSIDDFEKTWAEKEAYAADGYRLVTSSKVCVQCHQVGIFTASEPNKEGPPLALAHERLRPNWLTHWVDKPQRFLPYDSPMIMNFSATEQRWQALDAGSAIQQIHAVRDVLMNFPRIADMPVNRLYIPEKAADKK